MICLRQDYFAIAHDPIELQMEKYLNKKSFPSGKLFVCDPDKIRTCNLLIRNQVRYPVAPRGQFDVKDKLFEGIHSSL